MKLHRWYSLLGYTIIEYIYWSTHDESYNIQSFVLNNYLFYNTLYSSSQVHVALPNLKLNATGRSIFWVLSKIIGTRVPGKLTWFHYVFIVAVVIKTRTSSCIIMINYSNLWPNIIVPNGTSSGIGATVHHTTCTIEYKNNHYSTSRIICTLLEIKCCSTVR